jgi:hypothetical protein
MVRFTALFLTCLAPVAALAQVDQPLTRPPAAYFDPGSSAKAPQPTSKLQPPSHAGPRNSHPGSKDSAGIAHHPKPASIPKPTNADDASDDEEEDDGTGAAVPIAPGVNLTGRIGRSSVGESSAVEDFASKRRAFTPKITSSDQEGPPSSIKNPARRAIGNGVGLGFTFDLPQ